MNRSRIRSLRRLIAWSAAIAVLCLLAGVATVIFWGVYRLAHGRLASFPGLEKDASDHALTVAYWNLDWFPGQKPHASEAAQAAHIRVVTPIVAQLSPDILGLEEIHDRAAAQAAISGLAGFKVDVCPDFVRGPVPTRARFSAASPDPAAAGANPAQEPDHQQTVLCSRLPVLATGWQAWQPESNGRTQRRGLVFAIYRIADGEAALVYGLHLKSNVPDERGGEPTNVAMREEAARQLLAHERAAVAGWRGPEHLRLVIIGGDMNTSLDDPRFVTETTLRSLLAPDSGGFLWGWAGVPEARRLTLPAEGRYPAVCFDHIFYRPAAGGSLRLAEGRMPDSGRDASDHHPVWARFAW